MFYTYPTTCGERPTEGRRLSQQSDGKASSIVNYARKSTLAAELLEGENRLQTATVTCWNSQLKMIRSILSITEEKLNALDTISLTKYD